MTTSILHRATGVILSVGALALVWGLLALAGGAERWAGFVACMGSPLGKLALAGGAERWAGFVACMGSPLGKLALLGFSWALAYHLINGVRHLLQDGGLGFSIPDFVRSSWISIIGSVVLTALGWAIVLSHWGQA